VNDTRQQEAHNAQQRVIDNSPILTVPHLTDAPPVMLMQNPMAKLILKSTPRLHHQITCNNKPGILSATNVINPMTPINVNASQRSTWNAAPSHVQPHCGPQATQTAISTGAQQQVVTQQGINILTLREQALFSTNHTQCVLMKHAQNPNECQALHEPHGPSGHWSHNNKLQKVGAGSHDGRDTANHIW
jgi:hypothetical protein